MSKALRPSVCLSCRRLAIAPTIVTSTPSRTHTVPRPRTTSQCQRLHGSRSMRPGMRVVMVSPALAAMGHGLAAAQRRHAPEPALSGGVAPAGELALEVDRADLVLAGELGEHLPHDALHVALLVAEVVVERLERRVGDLQLRGGELEVEGWV